MQSFVGLESGGTKLAAVLVREDGELLASSIFPRDPGADAEATVASLEQAAKQIIQQSTHPVRAAGFGFGGYVDRRSQSPALCLHEPGWETGGVRERLAAALGIPVSVENDCKVAALAEAHLGAGASHETVFYVTLGTGVGGGIVRNGEIVTLGALGEAEIGHLVVEPHGPPCWCGGRGCVEAVCSGPGVVQLAQWLAARHRTLFLASPLAGATRITSRALVTHAEAADPFAQLVLHQSATYLAHALGTVCTLINPGVIVVGGGFGLASPFLHDAVRRHLPAHVAPAFRGKACVLPAALGEHVVGLGAALLARSHHIAG